MVQNLLAHIPGDLPQELFQTLVTGHGPFRLERIVSQGHCSAEGFWYEQPEHEWVVLLSGEAVLDFADPPARQHLHPGDAVLIPAHCRHRVASTSQQQQTVWLALFFGETTPD